MDKQIDPSDPERKPPKASTDRKPEPGKGLLRTLRRRLGHAAWSDVTTKSGVVGLP